MIGLNSLGLAIIIGPALFAGFVIGRHVGFKHGYQTGSRARAARAVSL